MFGIYKENSYLFIFLNRLFRQGYLIESHIYYIFQESLTYKLVCKILNKIKLYFQYSFLGKMTDDIEMKDNPLIISGSRFIKELLQKVSILTSNIRIYSKASVVVNYITMIKKDLSASLAQITIVILVIMISRDIILSKFLGMRVELLSVFMRYMLFLMCMGMLFYYASKNSIKK